MVDKTTGDLVEISWEKMSKSKFNGTDPEGALREYGTDVVRLFLLFKVSSTSNFFKL
jgi:leucyl-tRNA synthetase